MLSCLFGKPKNETAELLKDTIDTLESSICRLHALYGNIVEENVWPQFAFSIVEVKQQTSLQTWPTIDFIKRVETGLLTLRFFVKKKLKDTKPCDLLCGDIWRCIENLEQSSHGLNALKR